MYREFLGFSKMVKNIKKSKGHEEGSTHAHARAHTHTGHEEGSTHAHARAHTHTINVW